MKIKTISRRAFLGTGLAALLGVGTICSTNCNTLRVPNYQVQGVQTETNILDNYGQAPVYKCRINGEYPSVKPGDRLYETAMRQSQEFREYSQINPNSLTEEQTKLYENFKALGFDNSHKAILRCYPWIKEPLTKRDKAFLMRKFKDIEEAMGIISSVQ